MKDKPSITAGRYFGLKSQPIFTYIRISTFSFPLFLYFVLLLIEKKTRASIRSPNSNVSYKTAAISKAEKQVGTFMKHKWNAHHPETGKAGWCVSKMSPISGPEVFKRVTAGLKPRNLTKTSFYRSWKKNSVYQKQAQVSCPCIRKLVLQHKLYRKEEVLLQS